MKVLVSACLTGRNCKYNGGNNRNEKVLEFLKGKDVIEICPEMLSGLGAPRKSVEMVKGVIRSEDGQNFDADFRCGVEKAMEIVRKESADLAVLQSRSPSCGVKQIYDGTFTKTLIPGMGIFAKALADAGVSMMDAEDVPCIEGKNHL
ncbi:MAG: DUF523 domain-containing protein [Clostridia bacterium]|nr:DUF523 domain-containing protein [Lachnospiraceae bacterium]NCC00287.1 DUF523 domain-containing protein [Clostridia bacterium]NCD02311.1 DUF523 domain-containing protein [Clostridia bacterium]